MLYLNLLHFSYWELEIWYIKLLASYPKNFFSSLKGIQWLTTSPFSPNSIFPLYFLEVNQGSVFMAQNLL